MDLRRVVIVATGGTIAGSGNKNGYDSGVFTVDQLLLAVPSISDVAIVETVQFCNIGSQDMDFPTLQNLALRIQEIVNRADVFGVVVTHGTDTMEESSFFMSLVVNSTKPIVFTGSMRPASSLSPDGPLNLFDAAVIACSDCSVGRGVLVAMNGEIHDAHAVLKHNTTSMDSFQSPNSGVAGIVRYGSVGFFHPSSKLLPKLSSVDMLHVPLPRVDVYFCCTGMSVDLLEASLLLGAKGVVLAGVGNGNMSKRIESVCRKMVDSGIVVVRASRVPTGLVIRNGEVNDDESGFVVTHSLSAQKARVLLMVALGAGLPQESIQKLFMEY